MKKSEYFKVFHDEYTAEDWMAMKNRAARNANNYNDTFVIVEGPEPDTWIVMDIVTAIDMDLLYRWSLL